VAEWIGENPCVESAVFDGEIACVDDSGRSVFNDLLFGQAERLTVNADISVLVRRVGDPPPIR